MIILNHDQHLDEIMSARPSYRERLRDLDERILDCLYDDQLRAVSHAMYEPEPRRIDWTIARDLGAALALNFAGLGIGAYALYGAYMVFQMLRPL
jgi:hypothetical protein